LGFNLYQKKIGVIGTGKIGKAFIKIALGFGANVLAYDLFPDPQLAEQGVSYKPLDEVFQESDILSLHCPLTPENHYLINKESLEKMKNGVTIINTSRGNLINTNDVIKALKERKIGLLGIDVYEQEEKLFFKDLSTTIIEDETIQLLMSYPNVLVTAHQAFFTTEALTEISQRTLRSIADLSTKGTTDAEVLL